MVAGRRGPGIAPCGTAGTAKRWAATCAPKSMLGRECPVDCRSISTSMSDESEPRRTSSKNPVPVSSLSVLAPSGTARSSH
jgi:hypothetical protein